MSNAIMNVIRREVKRAVDKAKFSIRRANLARITDSYFAQLDGFGDEKYDDVEVWQNYGHASRPPSGSETMVVKPLNRGEGAKVIATNNRAHRPSDLEDGESVLYSTDDGQAQVRVKPDGSVHVYTEGNDSGTHIKINKGGDIEIFTGTDNTISDGQIVSDKALTVNGDLGSTYNATALTFTKTVLAPDTGGTPPLTVPSQVLPAGYVVGPSNVATWHRVWAQGKEGVIPVYLKP